MNESIIGRYFPICNVETGEVVNYKKIIKCNDFSDLAAYCIYLEGDEEYNHPLVLGYSKSLTLQDTI